MFELDWEAVGAIVGIVAIAGTVLACIFGLVLNVVKSFIDKKVNVALSALKSDVSDIEKELLASNKQMVSYANQMFASINQLTASNQSGKNDD